MHNVTREVTACKNLNKTNRFAHSAYIQLRRHTQALGRYKLHSYSMVLTSWYHKHKKKTSLLSDIFLQTRFKIIQFPHAEQIKKWHSDAAHSEEAYPNIGHMA